MRTRSRRSGTRCSGDAGHPPPRDRRGAGHRGDHLARSGPCYAALALGDDTARRAGRLSLNPLRHVDRVGTLLLPGALLLGQILTIGRVVFMFGWAKPVPVSAWRFRNPRQGMAIVAAAGPAMSFFLAWLGALALHLRCW